MCSLTYFVVVAELYEGNRLEEVWVRGGYPLTLITSWVVTQDHGPGRVYVVIPGGTGVYVYGLNVPIDFVTVRARHQPQGAILVELYYGDEDEDDEEYHAVPPVPAPAPPPQQPGPNPQDPPVNIGQILAEILEMD